MQAMNMNESDAKDVIRYLEELKSKLTGLDASGEVAERMMKRCLKPCSSEG